MDQIQIAVKRKVSGAQVEDITMLVLVVLISVITVVLNDREGIVRTLESLQHLDTEKFEWIVVDGYSSDGTYEYLKESNERLRFKLLRETPSGIYPAMNMGAGLATGKYLWFINSGDFIFKEALRQDLLDFLELNSGLGIVAFPVIHLSKNKFIYDVSVPRILKTGVGTIAAMNHQGCLIGRQAFGEIGGFDCNLEYAADGKLLDSLVEKFTSQFFQDVTVGFLMGGRSLQNISKVQKEIATYRKSRETKVRLFMNIQKSKVRLLILRFETSPIIRIPIKYYLSFRQKKILEKNRSDIIFQHRNP